MMGRLFLFKGRCFGFTEIYFDLTQLKYIYVQDKTECLQDLDAFCNLSLLRNCKATPSFFSGFLSYYRVEHYEDVSYLMYLASFSFLG